MSSAPPKRIDIDADRLRAIVQQTLHRPLTEDEYAPLAAVVETAVWLQSLADDQQADIRRLWRIAFGPSSEKTSVVFPADADADADEHADEQVGDEMIAADDVSGSAEDGDGDTDTEPGTGKRKGHGRRPATDYAGADRICVPHESLRPGDVCPACGKGKVYPLRMPKVIVRVTGGAPLAATVHELARLRCNLCGEVFTARAPPEVGAKKYDETAAAMIALLRYGSGLPHNRLEKLQRSLGIPVPASTQWDVVSDAAEPITPVYEQLIRIAAAADVVHNDDTTMPVLALTGKRRAREAPDDDPADRTGMFTTGIVARTGGRRIALFFTSRRHAGENLTALLAHRAAQLRAPIQMCDGLDRNLPQQLSTIVANCNSHARRHFVDVADNFPHECRYVLQTLGKVFRHEASAKKQQLSDDERLAFHQTHSAPVMAELKQWFEAQFSERTVEPNSGLGQAITYVLKRWDRLTLFLRVPGAPLENNIVEQTLKRAIMHRKNSLFYRSLRGARVGDIYMSLIHTAELCGVDPLDYLVCLQRHADAVRRAPADWLPWNYTEARARLADAAA